MKDPKNSTKKSFRLYKHFQQGSWIQKSVAFLHTNNEYIEKEIKKTILLTIASKKTPSNKFNEIKDLYNENYKSLKK
jgi:hypothetical protein